MPHTSAHGIAQAIIGLFITADKDVLIWIMLIMFFISVAVTALISKRRKWTEILCIFALLFGGTMMFVHVFFQYVVDVPFVKLETISLETNDD